MDGVYAEQPDGTMLFHPLPASSDEDIARLARAVCRKVTRCLGQLTGEDKDQQLTLERCNGLFDSRATKRRNFSDEAVPVSRHRPRFRDLSRADIPRSPVSSPYRRTDGRCPPPDRWPSLPSAPR
jgi:hypothetical protein